MYVSRASIVFLECNHNMHRNCLDEYLKSNLNCPICRKSLIDPKHLEEWFDEQLAGTIMPEEYRGAKMNIHCNDCQ